MVHVSGSRNLLPILAFLVVFLVFFFPKTKKIRVWSLYVPVWALKCRFCPLKCRFRGLKCRFDSPEDVKMKKKINMWAAAEIYYQTLCQSHFSGVYLVSEVFQDWRSKKENPSLYWHATLSCPFMAWNNANLDLVPISFWMLTMPWIIYPISFWQARISFCSV